MADLIYGEQLSLISTHRQCCGKGALHMQIALQRKDFRAQFLLPADLQRKSVFLWQLAEVAWRRYEAMEVLDHLLCLSQAVSHIYVVAAGPKGVAVASHTVYDPDADGIGGGDDWPSIVAGSTVWARDFVAAFEFSEGEPWRTHPPLFDFWAYDRADYQRLRQLL